MEQTDLRDIIKEHLELMIETIDQVYTHTAKILYDKQAKSLAKYMRARDILRAKHQGAIVIPSRRGGPILIHLPAWRQEN